MQVEPVLAAIEKGLPESLNRLMELLAIPSISADPAHDGDCARAAQAVKTLLADMGFAAKIYPTPAHPVVIASLAPKAKAHLPHVLFYGHYDVQPATPLELWKIPPFEPKIRQDSDGIKRIYARGASDDKGQFMTFLEATRAWLAVHGQLPFRLTVLIEGDEESDGSHLDAFLRQHADKLKADLAFVCDTDLWDAKTPAITTRLRGILADELVITGPRIDLHSGGYGGAAANPLHILTGILSQLRDAKGRITIPGFYDGVPKLSAKLKAQWQGLKFSERKFLKAVGLSKPQGEQAYSVLENIWARPTAEINGMMGGHTGAGGKTIIPSEAMAKLTFRLVGTQDPHKIRKAFRKFVRDRLPSDCKVRFDGAGGDSRAVTIPENSPFIAKAARALQDEWGRAPALIGSGGSIPIVEAFQRVLGMDSLMTGFAQESDAVHSPNEKYDVECYRKGMRSWARIIASFT